MTQSESALIYPNVPGWTEPTTSRKAAEAIADRAAPLREQVFELLCRKPMTADETARALGQSVLAIRPRVTELYKTGRVDRTGERRRNRSGLQAHVYFEAV